MGADRVSGSVAMGAEPRFDALLLRGGIQHYAWGDAFFIPSLIGVENPDRRPFAELWIGAHQDLPAEVVAGGNVVVPLDRWIDDAPAEALGGAVAERFHDQLPFLLKVLSASRPLSVQAHPDKRRAQAGYSRENQRAISLDAPHRCYRDPNHKPELLVALTPFHAFCGFRPLDEIAELLRSMPALTAAGGPFEASASGLAKLYGTLMRLNQDRVNETLKPILNGLQQSHRASPYGRDTVEYWLLKASEFYVRGDSYDRGLLSILLMNLVQLAPGEGIYVAPGELHTYLEGSAVELMANSNNVVRGGLTDKPIDVEELLTVVNFGRVGVPKVVNENIRDTNGVRVERYLTDAKEFELLQLAIEPGGALEASEIRGCALGVCLSGAVSVQPGTGSPFTLNQGGALFLSAGSKARLRASEKSLLYLARVPGD